MKALIIDDINNNLDLLNNLLGANGYEIKKAQHGKEALEILAKETVDLIITDIHLPEMDGLQLCYECKTNEDLYSIPFILYSDTISTKQDEVFYFELGADLFLHKPQSPELVLSAINQLLNDFKNAIKKPHKSNKVIALSDFGFLKNYFACCCGFKASLGCEHKQLNPLNLVFKKYHFKI